MGGLATISLLSPLSLSTSLSLALFLFSCAEPATDCHRSIPPGTGGRLSDTIQCLAPGFVYLIQYLCTVY